MWLTQIRGLIAVGLVVAAIAFAWTRIENSDTAVDAGPTTTTTTTTTTTLPATTTTSGRQAVVELCDLAQTFVDAAAALGPDAGAGTEAHLALDFWTDVLALAAPEIRTEVIAVVNYYDSYIETAEPFEFSTTKVILGGDKERLQQLITRPAPGLAASRGVIGFACGVEVADQPRMSSDAFDELEDRLLDPPDDE